ncbi:hypothetical protein SZN_18794 [Streptomyces zinciresistens K42]|uniref:C2H2-type domain-containing protein n=1 Tax=Streptomyces zinciresistens K42 TaxID=700597 RepID=G2GE29_9ACTN|nr:hypothetical protein [Streptomyces zinciresistens]EGX58216.1 hypothetical protein SZN_18794 [Streptomyces zinciresistens K42]
MSEITGEGGARNGVTAIVHESYSFACMRCGHGWEQSYEIEHHTDGEGREFVMYVADGQIVPSPLSRPTCANCDNHLVRIMRPGRVSSARDAAHRQRAVPKAGPVEVPGVPGQSTAGGGQHHWHLSDLLHVFQRKAG